MHTLQLQIFRFNAQAEYEYYFQKYEMPYDNHTTLFELLDSIEGLQYDRSFGFRVQGLCVFEDVRIADLVRNFGVDLTLEPLDQKYVSKDLTLDKEAMFARYEWFFEQYAFITSSHRYELYKFLWANTIASSSNQEYLGVGFFLYVKWLLGQYSSHFDMLLNVIAHPQNGIMSYAPLDMLIYAPSHLGAHITQEMNTLIQKVVSFGRCKEHTWLSLVPKLTTQVTILELEFMRASSQDTAYFVFDAYNLPESKPLLQSTKTLLKALHIPTKNLDSKEHFIELGGYFGRILHPESMIQRALYNLALAHKNGGNLVFGDFESYLYTIWALKEAKCASKIDIDSAILDFALQSKPLYIGEIIARTKKYTSDLLAQKTLAFYPATLFGYGAHLSNPFGVPLATSDLCQESLAILQNILAPLMRQNGACIMWCDVMQSREDFSHLEVFNSEYYLKESAKMRFCGIDRGADILVVSSLGLFRAFDTFAHKTSEMLGRNTDKTPVLFLPQVALLALGETDKAALGLRHHKLPL